MTICPLCSLQSEHPLRPPSCPSTETNTSSSDGAMGRISTGRQAGRRQVAFAPALVRSGRARDHVHAIAEQADRQAADSLHRPTFPQDRGGLPRLGGADLQDRAPHQLLHFARACRRPAAGRDGSAPRDGSARPRRDRRWRRRSSPSPAAAGRGSARNRGATRDRRRWSARRGRAPWACGSSAGQPQFLLHAAGQVAGQAAAKRRQVAEGQQPLGLLAPAFARGTL